MRKKLVLPDRPGQIIGPGDAAFKPWRRFAGGMGMSSVRRNNFGFENFLRFTTDFSDATWNTVAEHEALTVVGTVRALIMISVTADLTSGGAATIQFGWAGGSSGYCANQTYTNLVADRLVQPGGTVVATIARWGPVYERMDATGSLGDLLLVGGTDFGFEIVAAALTGGTLDWSVCWSPVLFGSTLVQGAGGVF